MARPGRPASESYQPVSCSVSLSASYSSEAAAVGAEDGDDQAPIFSLSKSSMDVVMATGPPHKRDPAWTRMDLRRSSSTNTHSEQNSVMLQQLHPRMWQRINTPNTHQSFIAQNADLHSPPALSERWITNIQRWSECSGSTQSRSSTPDTIVWKSGKSRPSSLTQETPCSSISKPTSPPTTPSSIISPLQTPPLPPADLLTPSSSALTPGTHRQEEFFASSRSPSPLPSPLQAHTSSPLPSNSPNLLQLTSAEDEGFLENNSLSFTFPSPIPSSVSLAEGGASDPGCLVDDVTEELRSPEGAQMSDCGGVMSPEQMLNNLTPRSPAAAPESGGGGSFCHLELPGQSCPTGRDRRSPLVMSLSDSLLKDSCRCKLNAREGITKAQVFREEGTMTSQLDLVDAAVQTITPISSFWNLRRNNSNMGSHSLLGSPPGSRLNLKASVGSHSNLVSPSSSMFPASSGEEEEERQEDDPEWDDNLMHNPERRRSCLKNQGQEKGQLRRRSSMKQVQWDEDGMTWDIHGAAVDPEELNMAIQKHLELQNATRSLRPSTKKKKAPKPPLISNVVKAMTPELHPPVKIITSTCMVEAEKEGTPEADKRRREVEEEKEGKKEKMVGVAHGISRAEGANVKEEEDEVNREEGTRRPKSPSHGSGHRRKRSVIRSLRRPGWCGGCKKTDD